MAGARSTADLGHPRAEQDPSDDTVGRRLTREERARLAMDAWEPSLLRELLKAEGRLSGEQEEG